MKATHNGTCQVCGRLQAARFGSGLAKHGYTVQQGWWSGICQGAGKPPLELSTILCDEIVRVLRERGPALASMTAEAVRSVLVSWRKGRDAWNKEAGFKTLHNAAELAAFLETEDGKLYGLYGVARRTWEDLQKGEAWRMRNQGEMMLAHAEHMEQLKARTFGQPLRERKAP